MYLYTQVQRQRNERDPNKNNKGEIMKGKNIDEREKCAVYLGGNWYVMFLDIKMSKIIESGTERITMSPFL